MLLLYHGVHSHYPIDNYNSSNALKKSARKKLIERLDTLVSIYIRRRDGECVICGSKQRLTNGHVFSRDTYITRWDLMEDGNCHCQCWPCNYRHEFDTYPFHTWYRNRFGDEKFAELYKRYRTIKKFKDFELEELIGEVELKLKCLTE